MIALGIVTGLVFGIKPAGDMPSASMPQLDLRARVRFGELSSDGLAPFGYPQLGGSWLFLPDDGETLSGPSAGLGFGLTHPIRDGAFLLFEIGYQASYQGGDDPSVVELSTDLLHFRFGLGRYL